MPGASRPWLILQHAALIQLLLVAVTVLAVGSLMVPEARRRLCGTAARMGAARLRRARRNTEAADRRRFAEEVAVAASRAATTAKRRHDEWVRAERTREAAWLAYEAADEAARRTTEAERYPVPDVSEATGADGVSASDVSASDVSASDASASDASASDVSASDASASGISARDIAANQRRLHHAATEAYRRGELSAEQLGDVLAQRNGWDPGLSPYEQEARLRRAVRDKLLSAYRTASEMERAARHGADTAAAAKRSLDDEASAAARRAREGGVRVGVAIPRQRTAASALGVDLR